AVIDLYGPIADTPKWTATLVGRDCAEAPELCKQVTPLSHLDKKDPPVMIMHGTADTTVDVRDSQVMAAALKQADIEHELVIVPGAPHTFHLQPKQRDLRPIVLGFFGKHLR
ncbi:MAG: prolyl oligopeptidase family serine peptidase, partial [Pirellulaceae bacterium]|nr:prolyl oligopeptidase family serine peptidase [Pirellulaceae bacterium]